MNGDLKKCASPRKANAALNVPLKSLKRLWTLSARRAPKCSRGLEGMAQVSATPMTNEQITHALLRYGS
eukprot:6515282-Pyramimonas_sp.AAC.1